MTEVIAPEETRSTAAGELADRYIGLWNEPDADRRRRLIAELWTEDGLHLLQPPEEIRDLAARPGIGMTAVLDARGYSEIEARVASAYREWVESQGMSFQRRDDAESVADLVKFHWEAITMEGEVFAVGLTLLLLAADGRIRRDYTFVVG